MTSVAMMHCFRCGAPKKNHGPEMQCPCIVYTHEGRFITWNKCKFLGLEIVAPPTPKPKQAVATQAANAEVVEKAGELSGPEGNSRA